MIKVIYSGTIEKSLLEEDGEVRDELYSDIVENLKHAINNSKFLIGEFTYEKSKYFKKDRVYFSVVIDLLPDEQPGASSD